MIENFYAFFESKNYASEDQVREIRSIYLPYVRPFLDHVKSPLAVDFGCGRGEWLEMLSEEGFRTQGVDFDQGMLSSAQRKGLDVQLGDGNDYLRQIPDKSVSVLTAFHVLEHLSFDGIIEFFEQSRRVLIPGGLLIAETPNPENLHVVTSNFYLDPTHIRLIPILQMKSLAQYFGYSRIALIRLQEQKDLYEKEAVTFRDLFYGVSKDYSLIAQNPGGSDELAHALDRPLQYETGISIDEMIKRLDHRIEALSEASKSSSEYKSVELKKEDSEKLISSCHVGSLPNNIKPKMEKILHRVYFENYRPFKDPFLHYLETWKRELPSYRVIRWGQDNVDVKVNEWMRRSAEANDPVFLSEYVRWAALKEYGGVYLDSDCEVLNGEVFDQLVDELISSDEYDAFVGVESYEEGFPTAQTIAAKKGAEIVDYMHDLYNNRLSCGLWHWRAERLLIGPQLMSLYFRDKGYDTNKGFFPGLKKPIVVGRVKIYPQDYFSPKFTTTGTKLNVTENTCIYHLFANLNVQEVDPEAKKHREEPMLFSDYCRYLEELARKKGGALPEYRGYRRKDGGLDFGKIVRQGIKNPAYMIKKIWNYAIK